MTLESGIKAPEIFGLTPEGDSLHLSDLRGQLVYIKVWATWCGPCLKSIPDWKLLQQEFEDKDELVFLSISIDSNKEKWSEMLTSRQLPGVHILAEADRMREDFMIPGIPRYMLIDKNGILVEANALRPHEDGIKELLESLL